VAAVAILTENRALGEKNAKRKDLAQGIRSYGQRSAKEGLQSFEAGLRELNREIKRLF
jgi:hypothetical protein